LTPFIDQLQTALGRCGNPVLVGLDPQADLLPEGILPKQRDTGWAELAKGFSSFCRGVIDVVSPLVAIVKPQAAFFEQVGPSGMAALADVIQYAQSKGLLVILDGKRNDIGSTAAAYARGFLGREGQSAWGADAMTVNPYLGDDSLKPFVDVATQRGAGVFVLVKTSNPGAKMFQDLMSGPRALHQHVAAYVEQLAQQTLGAGAYGSVGAVVGATHPEQLAQLRVEMPHTWFLVPGYGAQGATARDTAAAFDGHGHGAIINNSRGIIFAHRRGEYAQRFGSGRWQEAVEAATRDMIDQLRAETPAGRLAAR